MEILYTVLNIISSLVTEVLYDRSLVNSLFSFDLNKKYVVFNHAKSKIKSTNDEDNEVKDIQKVGTFHLKEKIQELENKNNTEIYAKENLGEQNIIPKTKVSSTRKKVVKKKKSQRSGATRFSKTSNTPLKEQIKFEKTIFIENEMEIEEAINEIEELNKKCEEYETYIKNDKILEEKSLEEVKNILSDVQKIDENNLGKNLAQDEYKDKIEFIKNIKKQIEPILIQKIRLFTLMKK